MTVEALGERLARLESRVQEVEERLPSATAQETPAQKRGWRWFIGRRFPRF